MRLKDEIIDVVNSSLKKNDSRYFSKYLLRLCDLLAASGSDTENAEGLFEFIKTFGSLAKADSLMRKTYEMCLGGEFEFISSLTLKQYYLYSANSMSPFLKAQVLKTADSTVKPVSDALDSVKTAQADQLKKIKATETKLNKQIKGLKVAKKDITAIESGLKGKIDAEIAAKTKTDITKLIKKEIAAAVKAQKTEIDAAVKTQKAEIDAAVKAQKAEINAMVKAEVAAAMKAQVKQAPQQVPALYAQGKLGFRTLIKSFKEWQKFKFSGKAKRTQSGGEKK